MRNENKIITIGKLNDNSNEFIAFFKHELLGATFSVSFNNSITGSIALNAFIEMIKQKYKGGSFDIVLSQENLNIKEDMILQGLTIIKENKFSKKEFLK